MPDATAPLLTDDTTEPKSARQKARTDDIGPLTALYAAMHDNAKAAGDEIGVSGSAVSGWLKDGSMPVTAHLACKQRLAEINRPLQRFVMTAVVTIEQRQQVVKILDALGVTSIAFTDIERESEL